MIITLVILTIFIALILVQLFRTFGHNYDGDFVIEFTEEGKRMVSLNLYDNFDISKINEKKSLCFKVVDNTAE